MTNQNDNTGTAIATLTPRQEKLLTLRDDMAPGAKPMAIVPRNFAEAQTMCMALARAGIVPAAFRDKPDDMIVVVMSGAEVGLPPMQSLRLYHIIEGVPRIGAEGIRAIVVSHPSCEYLEFKTSSEAEVTWIGKRVGRPEKSITWTLARAQKAGLLGKATWQKSPEDMLNARASMQLCRLIWPDVAAGLISREEALDGDFIETTSNELGPRFAPLPAQKSEPATPASNIADDPKLAGAQANIDEAKRKAKAKPIEAKATEVPTSAASTTSTPLAGSSSPSPSAAPASTSSAPASTAQAQTPTASSSTKLDAAVAKVEAKRAPAADPTTQAGSTEPATAASSPSTSSEASSPTETDSGASTDPDPEPEDDGFGGGDEPAAPTLNQLLKPFHAWLAECKNRRDLTGGLQKWKAWSTEQAKAGNQDFLKAAPGVPEGKATIEMTTAYAKRKSEVPE